MAAFLGRSGQPLQDQGVVVACVAQCLSSVAGVLLGLFVAHIAKTPPVAAGKQQQGDTPLETIFRSGSIDTFFVTVAKLSLCLHGVPKTAAPWNGHDLPIGAKRWVQTELLLQAVQTMTPLLGLGRASHTFSTVESVSAMIDLQNLACCYAQHCCRIVPAEDGNQHRTGEELLGRLGRAGQLLEMKEPLDSFLYSFCTRVADVLTAKFNHGLSFEGLRQPDGTLIGASAVVQLEARMIASVVRVLQLLLLMHLTWQATPDRQSSSVHISFLQAHLQCLRTLCLRHPWPQTSRRRTRQQQQRQQLSGSFLSVNEAQLLLTELHAVAWSVLRVKPSGARGESVQAQPGQLQLAHSYAAQLLTFIHDQQLSEEPAPVTAFGILTTVLESQLDVPPQNQEQARDRAGGFWHIVQLMVRVVVEDIRPQRQPNSPAGLKRDLCGPPLPPRLSLSALQMWSAVRLASNCLIIRFGEQESSSLNLEWTAHIIQPLVAGAAALLLPPNATAVAPLGVAGSNRFQPAGCGITAAAVSLWSQAPDVHRVASLHLLPALVSAGKHSLARFGSEYSAARKAEGVAVTEGQATEQHQRKGYELLTHLGNAVGATLNGVLALGWPALPGSAAQTASWWRAIPDAGLGRTLLWRRQQHQQQLPPSAARAATFGSSAYNDPDCPAKPFTEPYAHHAMLSLNASGVVELLHDVADTIRELLPCADKILIPVPAPAAPQGGRAAGDKQDKQESLRRSLQQMHQAHDAMVVLLLVQSAVACVELLVKLGSEATAANAADVLRGPGEGGEPDGSTAGREALVRLMLSSRWTYDALAETGILALLSSEAVVSLFHFPWRQPDLHPPDWQHNQGLSSMLQQLCELAKPGLTSRALTSVAASVCGSVHAVAAAMAHLLPLHQKQRQRAAGRQRDQHSSAHMAAQPGERVRIAVVQEDSDGDSDGSEISTTQLPLPRRKRDRALVSGRERQPGPIAGDRAHRGVEQELKAACAQAEHLMISCAELAVQQRAVPACKDAHLQEAGAGRGTVSGSVPAAVQAPHSRVEACALLARQGRLVAGLALRAAGSAWRATAAVGLATLPGPAGDYGEDVDIAACGSSSLGNEGSTSSLELAWRSFQPRLLSSDWSELVEEAYAQLGFTYDGCCSRQCDQVCVLTGDRPVVCQECKAVFCCSTCARAAFSNKQHACFQNMPESQLFQQLLGSSSEGSLSSSGFEDALDLGGNEVERERQRWQSVLGEADSDWAAAADATADEWARADAHLEALLSLANVSELLQENMTLSVQQDGTTTCRELASRVVQRIDRLKELEVRRQVLDELLQQQAEQDAHARQQS